MGVEFKRRGRIFERNLDLILRLWTEDSVTLQVDNHNLRQAVLLPKPYQSPHPPVLIGGYVEAVLRRAAAPRRSRPLEIWSRLVSVLAVATGFRSGNRLHVATDQHRRMG